MWKAYALCDDRHFEEVGIDGKVLEYSDIRAAQLHCIRNEEKITIIGLWTNPNPPYRFGAGQTSSKTSK